MEYSPIALALLNQATDTRLPRDKPGMGATLSDMMLQQAQQQSTQADTDAKRYALNKERRTQEMLKGMDLSDPAAVEKLYRIDPALGIKLMQQQRMQQEQKIMQDALTGGLDTGGGAEKLAALGARLGNPQLIQLAQFKQAQENRAQDLERGSAETTYKKEQAIFDTEKNLRSEFKDKTKDFIDQRDAFGRIVNSAKDPSGAGDLSLIFNYMKVLDPGSTVREGEFAQVGKAGGLPGEIQNMFNRITGGERLTPEIRKDIVSRAGKLYQGAEEQTSILADEYTSLASQYGAKPDRVVGKFGLPDKIKKDYDLLTGNTERQQALDAIAAGANPEEVKAFYKSRTGEDL